MTDPIASHYGSTGIARRILDAVAPNGLPVDGLDPDALSGVDEFHLGGRAATAALLADLELTPGSRVVDVGCGIGGAARAMAHHGDCQVTGIDLTPEFIAAATELGAAVGLADQTQFEEGNALALPFVAAEFDAATMLHVGMNIDDKTALMAELTRVVRPGGVVAVYDIMRLSDGEITFPVPWASSAETSFVASPEAYVAATEQAGLTRVLVEDRTELVLEAMANAQAAPQPPANLGHLMGPEFPIMIGNVVPLVRTGVLAPVQITAVR